MFVQEKTLVLYTEDKTGKTSLNNSKGTKLDEQRAQSWAEEPLAAGGLKMAPTQPQLTSVNQYWMSLVQKKRGESICYRNFQVTEKAPGPRLESHSAARIHCGKG